MVGNSGRKYSTDILKRFFQQPCQERKTETKEKQRETEGNKGEQEVRVA